MGRLGGCALCLEGATVHCRSLSPSSLQMLGQRPSPGCHRYTAAALVLDLGAGGRVPRGQVWPSHLHPSQTRGGAVRLSGTAPGRPAWGVLAGWLLENSSGAAGAAGTPRAGLLPGRQGTVLGMTTPGGEGHCPNLTARWLSLKVAPPPLPRRPRPSSFQYS